MVAKMNATLLGVASGGSGGRVHGVAEAEVTGDDGNWLIRVLVSRMPVDNLRAGSDFTGSSEGSMIQNQ